MPPTGYVVVSTQPTAAEAELLVGLLRSGGVRAEIDTQQNVEYPVTLGAFRVVVPGDQAASAEDLLMQASHLDPTDPASSLDVGLPVDDDVRDYLAWRRDVGAHTDVDGDSVGDTGGPPVDAAHVLAPPTDLTGARAPSLPLLPLLGLAALVIALVVLLR